VPPSHDPIPLKVETGVGGKSGGGRKNNEQAEGVGKEDEEEEEEVMSPVSRVMRGESLEEVARQVVRARMQQQLARPQPPQGNAQLPLLQYSQHAEGGVSVAGALLMVRDDALEKVC